MGGHTSWNSHVLCVIWKLACRLQTTCHVFRTNMIVQSCMPVFECEANWHLLELNNSLFKERKPWTSVAGNEGPGIRPMNGIYCGYHLHAYFCIHASALHAWQKDWAGQNMLWVEYVLPKNVRSSGSQYHWANANNRDTDISPINAHLLMVL